MLLHILLCRISVRLGWQPIWVFSLLHPFRLLVGGINLCQREKRKHSDMKEKHPITPLAVILNWDNTVKYDQQQIEMYIVYELPAAELPPLWVPNFQVFIQVTFFFYGTESKHRSQWAAGGHREPTRFVLRERLRASRKPKNMDTNSTVPYFSVGKYIHEHEKEVKSDEEQQAYCQCSWWSGWVSASPAEDCHSHQVLQPWACAPRVSLTERLLTAAENHSDARRVKSGMAFPEGGSPLEKNCNKSLGSEKKIFTKQK